MNQEDLLNATAQNLAVTPNQITFAGVGNPNPNQAMRKLTVQVAILIPLENEAECEPQDYARDIGTYLNEGEMFQVIQDDIQIVRVQPATPLEVQTWGRERREEEPDYYQDY